jgi:hypothetical protein
MPPPPPPRAKPEAAAAMFSKHGRIFTNEDWVEVVSGPDVNAHKKVRNPFPSCCANFETVKNENGSKLCDNPNPPTAPPPPPTPPKPRDGADMGPWLSQPKSIHAPGGQGRGKVPESSLSPVPPKEERPVANKKIWLDSHRARVLDVVASDKGRQRAPRSHIVVPHLFPPFALITSRLLLQRNDQAEIEGCTCAEGPGCTCAQGPDFTAKVARTEDPAGLKKQHVQRSAAPGGDFPRRDARWRASGPW